jgi:hypothetical protein
VRIKIWKPVGAALLVAVAAGLFGFGPLSVLKQDRPPPRNTGDRVPPRNTGNSGHDRLAELSAEDRAFLVQLQLAVSAPGQTVPVPVPDGKVCEVAHVVFLYFEKTNRISAWRADCKDGRSFSLVILPDAEGSTKVMSCAEVKKRGGDCFYPFSDKAQ